ncbi:MAG: phosphotransferase [Dehalococcoidia bacterium]|nr:phosphotransferase [Dehalococcoidia bacterium]
MLLTPEWFNRELTSILGLTDTHKVVNLRRVPLGDGYAASTHRIELKYSENNKYNVQSIVVKSPITDSSILKTAQINGIYEREVEFYRIMSRTGFDAHIPRCYYADFDSESGDFVLVLEDLSSRIPGNHHTSRPLHEIKDVFRAYGRLHHRFFSLAELRDGIFLAKPGNGKFIRRQMQQLLDAMVVKLEPYMGEGTRHRILGQLNYFEKLYEYSKQAQHSTLTHGDAHQANVMFGKNGEKPVILDWQLARFGIGMEDIARFLLLSTEPEFRRAHTDELIAVYADELSAIGSDLTFTECQADYLPMLALQGCMSLLAVGAADFTQSEEQQRTGEKLCTRLATVIDELETEAAKLSIWT